MDAVQVEDKARQRLSGHPLVGLLLRQESILLIITAIAIAILASQNERFLTVRNLMREVSLGFEIALIALPMTFIIITGGIDLSVASTFAVSAIVMGFLWQDSGWPLELAMVMCLFTGLICGLINGLGIVRVGVPPLIMTLATLALYRGVAVGISEARSARNFPDWFLSIGRGDYLGAPLQVWILLAAIILATVALSWTTFGRSLYAMGNNELAARFAGVPADRYKLVIYTLSGLAASVAGLIYSSRISVTRSDMGFGMELDVITAVVLGGTSIFGGSGSIFGTVLGLILIQALKSGLLLAGVKGDATIVMIGFVLVLAILVNNFIESRFRSV